MTVAMATKPTVVPTAVKPPTIPSAPDVAPAAAAPAAASPAAAVSAAAVPAAAVPAAIAPAAIAPAAIAPAAVAPAAVAPAEAAPAEAAPVEDTHLTATFTGEDSARAVTTILAAASLPDITLVDLRQTVVHKRLTLVLEVDVTQATPRLEAALYKALLSTASALTLRVDIEFTASPISSEAAASTPGQCPSLSELPLISQAHAALVHTISKPDTQYVVTLLSPSAVTPLFLTHLAEHLAKYGLVVAAVSRLSSSNLRCLELVVRATFSLTPTTIAKVRKHLYALGRASMLDVALQAECILRRSKRLVVFDMDSTLIQQEVIDELALYAGVYDQVRDLTHQAMIGQIDFRESLEQRCLLLKGAPASLFDRVIANLQYTAGAKTLCRSLKRLGYRLAVISGGFTRVTKHVRYELGLDYDYANELEEVNGILTGETVGPIVTARRKADLLMSIAQLENITLDQVIAVGDGANDLPMLGTAGVGVAFNAKPAVQDAASFGINQSSLMTVLYLLGLSEQDQEELSGHGGSVRTNGSMASSHDVA